VAAQTCRIRKEFMDYVIAFITVAMVALYALIIGRCLPKS
jgi:hypothetical protein